MSGAAARTIGETPTRKIVFVPRYRSDEFLRPGDSWLDYRPVIANSPQELADELPDADVLVVGNRSYDADLAGIVRQRGTSLRLIQFSTSGLERGLRFGLPDGVTVACAPGVKASSVAEHALALILADFRRLRPAADAQARLAWDRAGLNEQCRNLEDAVVLVIGMGAIGQDVARKLKAFDAEVIGINRSPKACPHADKVIGLGDLDLYLPKADVVVLCAPAHAENIGLINRARLRLMQPRSLLVNVARGELIDERALVEALQNNWIRAAALDVAEEEPPADNSPLWSLPTATLTPHIAGSGKGGYNRFRSLLLENLQRLSAGETLLHTIDRNHRNSGTFQ
ncbi:D-2-hydroxyacid dehydrogenase [Roseiarcaceae bacterium H3SJ34-1]|uniref:D-2-hydroxyacid dehydrogenase n=1 Tax=Terripilifer ovatus TaxID=3032367 RepID=UPI003AB987BD|nr:D-2-hydroxyacid dehydrogenase [Roseiarcaceae bacterium H3SJ34-1]